MFYTTTQMLGKCQNFKNKILLSFGEKKDQFFEEKTYDMLFFSKLTKVYFCIAPFLGGGGCKSLHILGKLVRR